MPHLKQWEKALEERWDKGDHWYELRPCDYYDNSITEDHLPDIAKESRFTLVSDSLYFTNSAYFISKNDHFLLGVLNSSAIWRYATEKLTVLGDAAKGGRLRFFTQFCAGPPHSDCHRRPEKEDRRPKPGLLKAQGQRLHSVGGRTQRACQRSIWLK